MKKNIMSKIVTAMLIFTMAFTCIPSVNLYAEEDPYPEYAYDVEWDITEPNPHMLYSGDYGETVIFRPTDGKKDEVFTSFQWFRGPEATEEYMIEGETKSTLLLSNISYNDEIWVKATAESGTVYVASIKITINGLAFNQTPAWGEVNVKAGESVDLTLCPYVDGCPLPASDYEYRWMLINGKDDYEYENDEDKDEVLAITTDGKFKLEKPTKDMIICCHVYKDNFHKAFAKYIVEVNGTLPNTGDEDKPSTETKPDSSTETKPDSSTETKPDSSTETKPDSFTETKPDSSTETKPDSSTEKKPSSSTERKPSSQIIPIGKTVKVKGARFKIISSTKATMVSAPKTKKVTVPSVIIFKGRRYKVTSIDKTAFKNNTQISSVVIGDNITSLAGNLFKNRKKLTTVVVGKNVKSIGKNAFYGCKKLNKVVVKSKVLKSVGKNAFRKAGSSKLVVKIPKGKKKVYQKLMRHAGLKGRIK